MRAKRDEHAKQHAHDGRGVGVGVVAVVIAAWTGGSAASALRSDSVRQPRAAEHAAPTAAAHRRPARAGVERLREPADCVRGEPRSDGRAGALLRGGPSLRLLSHARRAGALVHGRRAQPPAPGASPGVVAAATPEPAQQRNRDLAAVPRWQPTRPCSESEERAAARSTTSAATTRRAGRRRSRRYGEIVYRELWPGVDLSLREQDGTLKYRVPGAAGRADRRHRSGLPRVERPCAGRRGRAADRDGHGRAARLAAGGVPDDCRRARAGREPLRAAATEEGPLRVRRGAAISRTRSSSSIRAFNTPPSSAGRAMNSPTGIAVDAAGNAYVVGHDAVTRFSDDDRARSGEPARPATSRDVFVSKLNAGWNGARVLHVHRRQQLRFRTADRDRRGGQRLRDRPDEILQLPHDRRRVRQDVQHRQLPAVRHRSIRHLRHEVERGRLRPGLLHLPRRHRYRRCPRHRGGRRGQRVRDRRDDVARFPDDGRRLRPGPQRRRTTSSSPS